MLLKSLSDVHKNFLTFLSQNIKPPRPLLCWCFVCFFIVNGGHTLITLLYKHVGSSTSSVAIKLLFSLSSLRRANFLSCQNFIRFLLYSDAEQVGHLKWVIGGWAFIRLVANIWMVNIWEVDISFVERGELSRRILISAVISQSCMLWKVPTSNLPKGT